MHAHVAVSLISGKGNLLSHCALMKIMHKTVINMMVRAQSCSKPQAPNLAGPPKPMSCQP